MREQIESYIKVLNDRRKIAREYSDKARDQSGHYFDGQADLLDDIIAELEGLVKLQNVLDMLLEAASDDQTDDWFPEPADDRIGFPLNPKEVKRSLLDRIAGKGNYAVDEDGNYDVDASGGPPSPMVKRDHGA